MQWLLRFAWMMCASALPVSAQWEMQDAHVTADLRGIDYVGEGVAWASGSHGTVLRTVDMGKTWQLCATPPDAQDLDFRGVQAFDDKTAIVMSSGPGDKSRLYKTTDGCQTWTLVFTNPDKDGFWDAFKATNTNFDGFWDAKKLEDEGHILILGDPVGGYFQLRYSADNGRTWKLERTVPSYSGEGAFAASNSSLLAYMDGVTECQEPQFFVTGGPQGGRVFLTNYKGRSCKPFYNAGPTRLFSFSPKGASAGLFSIAMGNGCLVFVGGDYAKPNERVGTAGYQCMDGSNYKPANTFPGGYRSSVAFEHSAKYAISVGPNGTDLSTDNGRNWRALKPGPGDAADADKNWNALSLPFVVGPKGRIGVLRDAALGGGVTGKP